MKQHPYTCINCFLALVTSIFVISCTAKNQKAGSYKVSSENPQKYSVISTNVTNRLPTLSNKGLLYTLTRNDLQEMVESILVEKLRIRNIISSKSQEVVGLDLYIENIAGCQPVFYKNREGEILPGSPIAAYECASSFSAGFTAMVINTANEQMKFMDDRIQFERLTEQDLRKGFSAKMDVFAEELIKSGIFSQSQAAPGGKQ
ncbi:MAG: hypothetical protein HQK54_13725 [Oligoflexales bacterium]|nr:hypothetical protein [Oligoflexales bacterium]